MDISFRTKRALARRQDIPSGYITFGSTGCSVANAKCTRACHLEKDAVCLGAGWRLWFLPF